MNTVKAVALFLAYVAGGAVTLGGLCYLIGWALAYFISGAVAGVEVTFAAGSAAAIGAAIGAVSAARRLIAALGGR